MIISHKYKYIFIKTKKTAGTSIEDALGIHTGPDDIVTPIGGKGVGLLANSCKNYLTDRKITDRELYFKFENWNDTFQFHQHMPAVQIVDNVSKEVWDTYFKFAFERNPWDKYVAWWCFERDNRDIRDPTFKMKPFRDWVYKYKGGMKSMYHCKSKYVDTDYDLYSIDGKVIVDFVGRFENLQQDFEAVCERLGIPWEGDLPRDKAHFRREHERDYRQFYTPDTVEIIAKRMHREIDLMGYTF